MLPIVISVALNGVAEVKTGKRCEWLTLIRILDRTQYRQKTEIEQPVKITYIIPVYCNAQTVADDNADKTGIFTQVIFLHSDIIRPSRILSSSFLF